MTLMTKLLAAAALSGAAFAAPLAASAATVRLPESASSAPALDALQPDPAAAPDLNAAPTTEHLSPAPVVLQQATKRSSLPEPATWAMMMLGFGGAGALLRRRGGGRMYRLVEALPTGEEVSEEFAAPDDATAWKRATMVAEGHIELWRGNVRVAPKLNA